MQKLLLSLVILFVVGLSCSYAQSDQCPIGIEKAGIGHRFYRHGGEPINSVRQLKDIIRNDKEALGQLRWATFDDVVSYFFCYAGGFALGWQLADVLLGRGFYAPLVIGGVASIGVGFLFTYLTDRRMVKGAKIFNEHLGVTMYGAPIELDFGLAPGGVGLTLSF
jgi:hypothetical protein